ncbi:MAG: Flp pilus assembly complex ATPase component TadA, partial [Proteobacteria bacterium]|nr:Flp pilus assembly complex ATPase component TadA [Pseudomonadota bacterium]
MAIPEKIILTGLARKLADADLISEADADAAIKEALKQKIALVTYLVKQKLVSSQDIALTASREFRIPLADINGIELDQELIKSIDLKMLSEHHVLPVFSRGKSLFVAISDSTDLLALDAIKLIKFSTKMRVEPILVEEDKLAKKIEWALDACDDTMKDLTGDLADIELVDDVEEEDDEQNEADEAPVVKFINKMLFDAIKMGASDLHFEPYEKFYRVRFRVDGMLRTITEPPIGLARKLAARLKVMSRLDVSERRVPQDGRIKLKISKSKSIDFRVSTCPILWG